MSTRAVDVTTTATIWQLDGESEICNLQDAVASQEEVGWFEVSECTSSMSVYAKPECGSDARDRGQVTYL